MSEDADKLKESIGVTGQLVPVDKVRLAVFGSGES